MTEKLKITLMDTTLRDGEQTQSVSFTPGEKTNLAKSLLQKLRHIPQVLNCSTTLGSQSFPLLHGVLKQARRLFSICT